MKHNTTFLLLISLILLLLSVNTNVFALIAVPISNLTLVFYSLSVPCIWKLSSILSWQAGTLLQHKKQKQISQLLIVFMLFYIATTILSLYSCLKLFPHPYIHKYLIGTVYFVGFVSAINIVYIASCIRRKKIPAHLLVRHKIQSAYSHLCIEREKHFHSFTEKFSQARFLQLTQKEKALCTFRANKHTIKRISNISLYICVFLWIFVVIPATSLEQINLFYTILFTIVISGCCSHIISTILSSYKTCFIYKHGIIIKALHKTNYLFWEQIKNITITDIEIVISSFSTPRKLTIPFPNVKQDLNFLEMLLKNGEFLFEAKAEENWNQFKNISSLFNREKRKIKNGVLKKIEEDKLYLFNKEELFYIIKRNGTVKVFQGKVPFEIYFVEEHFWKQIIKNQKESKFLEQFVTEYKQRLNIKKF